MSSSLTTYVHDCERILVSPVEVDDCSCQCCAHIVASYRNADPGVQFIEMGPISSLCAHVKRVISSDNVEDKRETHEAQPSDGETIDSDLLILMDGDRQFAHWSGHMTKTGMPWKAIRLVEGDNKTGGSRLIDHQWVDLNLVRSWVDCCVSTHGDACARPSLITTLVLSPPEWLIDVEKDCVVPVLPQSNPQYVALSYSWGQIETLKLTRATIAKLTQSGALRLSSLPETIRDAIGITKQLRQELLWIDSLCIIQDDPGSLRRSISNMPSIYAQAHFCLVAEAGVNARYGLRGVEGVSQPRYHDQLVFVLDGGEKLTRIPVADEPIDPKTLHYHRRAWTYQEWLFARRKLVFGSGPIRWICPCSEWREDLSFTARPLPDSNYASTSLLNHLNNERFSFPTLIDLQCIVSEFNRRNLTYPCDAYIAFAGIQTILQRVFLGGLIYGLPEIYFEIALCWIPEFHPEVPKPIRRLDNTSSRTSSPTQDLPTWSWMAWQGDIMFPHDYDLDPTFNGSSHCAVTGTITAWYTMESHTSTTRRPIRSQWFDYQQRYNPPPGREPPEPPHGWMRDDKQGYKHTSRPDRQARYPIPFWTPGDSQQSNLQTSLLYCQTSRAYMTINRETLHELHHVYDQLTVFDQNKSGVATLSLSDTEIASTLRDLHSTRESVILELVAVSEGWVKMPLHSTFTQARNAQSGSTTNLKEQRLLREHSQKHCYFVLWVEWELGVAYRRAVGQVLVPVWEKLKEGELVDLVLG